MPQAVERCSFLFWAGPSSKICHSAATLKKGLLKFWCCFVFVIRICRFQAAEPFSKPFRNVFYDTKGIPTRLTRRIFLLAGWSEEKRTVRPCSCIFLARPYSLKDVHTPLSCNALANMSAQKPIASRFRVFFCSVFVPPRRHKTPCIDRLSLGGHSRVLICFFRQ